MSVAPAIEWIPTPCPRCSAATAEEAGELCQPGSDESGEYSCPGDREDDQGRLLQPSPESLAQLDAWIAEEMAEQQQRTACALTVEAVALTILEVARTIDGVRIDLTSEAVTQALLEGLFRDALGADRVSREHRLGPGERPDFLIDGRFVVEVKGPRHRAPAVLRQLVRYAAYPQVEGMVLATSRAMTMPARIGGKPTLVVNLGRAWL